MRWARITTGTFAPGMPSAYAGRSTQSRLSAFAEWAAPSLWTIRPTIGIQGTSVAGRTVASPRATLELPRRLGLEWRLGAERRYQFETEFGTSIEGALPQPRVLLSSPRRADVASLRATWRGGARADGWPSITGTAELFGRRYADRTSFLPPASGSSDSAPLAPRFPDFARLSGTARGLAGALSFAHVRWSGQIAYTYLDVWERDSTSLVRPDWFVRHSLAVLGAVRLTPRTQLTGVMMNHDGPVSTPVVALLFAPSGLASPTEATLSPRYVMGPRNSARLTPYRRIDIGLRRDWDRGGATWALSLQALNVFNRRNALSYDWTRYFCAAAGKCDDPTKRTGMPLMPSISLEVRW